MAKSLFERRVTVGEMRSYLKNLPPNVDFCTLEDVKRQLVQLPDQSPTDQFADEFLLPQIRKKIDLQEVPFARDKRENVRYSKQHIESAVRKLGPWEYYFPLSYGLSTRINSTFNDDTIKFHRFRSQLISETVAQLLGKDLAGATILDLASHCGFFSLDIAYRGARLVRGLEYRKKNIDQALFLKKHYDIKNVTFHRGDIYDLRGERKYDVVLCLGILYHVVRPVDLLEMCLRLARKFVVIDSICHKEPIAAYKVLGDKNVEDSIEGTRPVELQPTYRGLIETMRQVGFTSIIEVVGVCSEHIDLYSNNYRRCLIASRSDSPA